MEEDNKIIIPIEEKNRFVVNIKDIPKFNNMVLISDYEDDKAIKRVESLIRQSREYKTYIKKIKTYENMDKCIFMSKIPTDIVKIEMHHSPFTLFDITQVVAAKLIKEKGVTDEFDIANEVCMLHWKNIIGLVPIGITIHELAHNFKISIHPNDVYGDWKKFVSLYKDFFPDSIKSKYEDIVEILNSDRKKPLILEVKHLELNFENIKRLNFEYLKNNKLLK